MTATTADACLPAVTRMLLASDGSTTYLLEAMLGTRLSVVVDEQRHNLTATAIAPAIARLVGLNADDAVLLRTSRLVTDDGATISRNLVTARWPPDPAIAEIITDRTAPIGPALRHAGIPQARRILRSGTARWSQTEAPAAFKEYVINRPAASPVHIRETFNPHFVPTVKVLASGTGEQR